MHQSGFPEIKVLDKELNVYDFTWKDARGLELTDISENIALKSGETYLLTELKLKSIDGYEISEDTKIYVNGYEYTGSFEVDGQSVTFINVGQFIFE
jgi:hypothetical protein